MEIIIFALVFLVITVLLLKFTKSEDQTEHGYDLTFVKGTARGSIGMITSMETLEELRSRLNSKKSKF